EIPRLSGLVSSRTVGAVAPPPKLVNSFESVSRIMPGIVSLYKANTESILEFVAVIAADVLTFSVACTVPLDAPAVNVEAVTTAGEAGFMVPAEAENGA